MKESLKNNQNTNMETRTIKIRPEAFIQMEELKLELSKRRKVIIHKLDLIEELLRIGKEELLKNNNIK